jgi:2,5-furandicarboxylate decarboxylase 1
MATQIEAGARSSRTQRRGKDLRSFLQRLVAHDPEQLLVVDREVDPILEATALVDRLRSDRRYTAKLPAVLFKRIAGSEIPLVLNLFGTYERVALMIDSSVKTMVEDYTRLQASPLPVARVERADAPVKERIITGDAIDLGRLPLLKHHEHDAGKYITSAVVITRDPATGRQNAGVFRSMIQGRDEIGMSIGDNMDTGYILWQYANAKRPMEVALVIGHHPAVLQAATTNPPGVGGELEIAGGLLGEPVELVPAETVDLEVPARAEIVIEGVINPARESFREEGPFGESPRYYAAVGPQPWLKVTAITMRANPLYLDLFNAHDEHIAIGALPRMGYMLTRVREFVPTVTALNLPISASARLHAYISMKKRSDGEPHIVAFAALASNHMVKHVFIVDDDIDVFNEQEVMWAFATRFQADKDMVVIPNSAGTRLNPVTYGYRRDEKGQLETKLIFDCTRPAPPAKFPPTAKIPRDLVDSLDPDRYVRRPEQEDLALFGADGSS